VSQLRFTTLVEAPLTVAFDVARALGRPWGAPLSEVVSERPVRDVYAARPGRGFRWLTHSRRFSATGAGTLVDEQVDWYTGLPGPLGGFVDQVLLRRRVVRAMQAHLDLYAAAAARRALDVVQVVGAAVVAGDRVLVAQRSGGPFDGCWEFPGGKLEPGESELAALVREIREELGVGIVPQAFVGEVPLDGVVAGGEPGASTLRVWWARLTDGEPVAHEHTELRWVGADELAALDWIPADRPLLPAVRALLARRP
jgi:8-oxo-dGTP diphosphatase